MGCAESEGDAVNFFVTIGGVPWPVGFDVEFELCRGEPVAGGPDPFGLRSYVAELSVRTEAIRHLLDLLNGIDDREHARLARRAIYRNRGGRRAIRRLLRACAPNRLAELLREADRRRSARALDRAERAASKAVGELDAAKAKVTP